MHCAISSIEFISWYIVTHCYLSYYPYESKVPVGGKFCASRSNIFSTWCRDFIYHLILYICNPIVILFIFVCFHVLICELSIVFTKFQVKSYADYGCYTSMEQGNLFIWYWYILYDFVHYFYSGFNIKGIPL